MVKVVGTRVPSPVRRQFIRHHRPSGLLTVHHATILRPGKLLGLWPLLCCLILPTFPMSRRLRWPLGFLAERRLALFRPGQPRRINRHQSEPRLMFPLLSTVLRHTGFHSANGYCTVTLGRDPAVPIVAGIPVVDP